MKIAAVKTYVIRLLKTLLRYIAWLIPVVIVVLAVMKIAKPKPPEYTQEPNKVMMAYMDLILPFLPPSAQKPTPELWSGMLKMFSNEDRKWAENHFAFLAWMGLEQDDRRFTRADELERTHAAFRFLSGHGPTQAFTIQKTEIAADGKSAVLRITNMRGTSEIQMIMEDGRWRFKGLWGIPSRFASLLASFEQKGIK